MPLVSVVMPVFNGERFLADAIESILAQTFTDFELLIVDDGSQDGSAEIVRAYANRDERVRLLQLERNAGFGTARNYGIKASNGKYITGMDCDDISLPERLQRQVDFMRANPEVGALGTNMQATTENLKPLVPYYHPQQHAAIVCGIFLGTSLAGTTVMHRREFLESTGGYEAGRRTSDDIELLTRLIWQTKLANLPKILYLYRQHGQQSHNKRDEARIAEAWETRERLLQRLWDAAPEATLDRFSRMRRGLKFGWIERKLARRDIERLIESLINHNLVEPNDRPLLVTEMNRRLEQTTPRLWQMFLHWRRHNFGR